MSVPAAAEALDCQPKTIYRWLEAGCPHERVDGKVSLDLKAVRDWHEARRGTPDPTGKGKPSVLETAPAEVKERIAIATLRKLVAQAERVELDLAARRGLFLPRADVESGRLARIAYVRSALLALPARLGTRCADRSAVEIEREADEEVRKVLEEFSRG